MPTLLELCGQTPDPAHGIVTQAVSGSGDWRLVFEVADPGVGASVQWHDVSAWVSGCDLTRGAPEYLGRFTAAVANVELVAQGDSLRPWNPDTSSLFGIHVDLGAGCLFRAGWIRVQAGTVTAWKPRFTHRIESWSDGRLTHSLVTRDLLTELVNVPIGERVAAENWPDRIDAILAAAGWSFGYQTYGAERTSGDAPVLELPARPDVPSAIEELDATTDPAGLVWYTSPIGAIIIRPAPFDTWHAGLFAAGATGTEWLDLPPVRFSATYDDDGGAAYAWGPGIEFGVDDSELQVVNSVRVSDPVSPTPFDYDDPVSIDRHGRRQRTYSWLAANNLVAQSIVDARAFATVQARPIQTQIDYRRFFPNAVDLEWLAPVELSHRTQPAGLVVTLAGRVRQIRELFRPRHPNQAISYQKLVTIDADGTSTATELAPVENLSVFNVEHDRAQFSWTNPSQTLAPTATQVRLPAQSLIWVELDYPETGFQWFGLDAEQFYQFDVRLIRREGGVITNVSPVESVTWITPASPAPDPNPDGNGGLIVTLPDAGDGCVIDWTLESTDDGTTWTLVTSGTANGGDQIDLDAVLFEAGLTYRVCSTEVCSGVPGTTYCSPLTVPVCQVAPAWISGDPYDRADLIAFIPEFCPPRRVIEYVSGIDGVRGPAWDSPFSVSEDDIALATLGSTGGVIAYGTTPTLDMTRDSATIRARVSVQNQDTSELFTIAGLRIGCEPGAGSGWLPTATVVTARGESVTVTGSELPLITPVWLQAAYDTGTGELTLLIDDAATVKDTTENAGDRADQEIGWRVAAPAASWITDCGVWDTAIGVDFLDDFNSYTEGGADLNGQGPWTASVGAVTVEDGGTIQITGPGRGATWTANQVISRSMFAEIDVVDYPGGFSRAGPSIGRITNDATDANRWDLVYDPSSDTWQIQRRDVVTQVVWQSAVLGGFPAPSRLRLEGEWNATTEEYTLRAYSNGGLLGSVVDDRSGVWQPGRYAGFWGANTVDVDNFAAGPLGAGDP